jgi:hypothetical protein
MNLGKGGHESKCPVKAISKNTKIRRKKKAYSTELRDLDFTDS